MKREWVWLTLPVILFATIWGVKHHRDHPNPTALDLKERERLSSADLVLVYVAGGGVKFPADEFRTILPDFYILPQIKGQNAWRGSIVIHVGEHQRGQYQKDKKARRMIFDVRTDQIAYELYDTRTRVSELHPLHPTTVRHIREFLKRHPELWKKFENEIGPALSTLVPSL